MSGNVKNPVEYVLIADWNLKELDGYLSVSVLNVFVFHRILKMGGGG